MNSVNGAAVFLPSPPLPSIPEADFEAAEDLILSWDPTALPTFNRMLFNGSDRAESDTFLSAVDQIIIAVQNSPAGATYSNRKLHLNIIQTAMVRLEDEFQHLLISTTKSFEINSFADLSERRDAINDLRSIARRMIAAGYHLECFHAYGSVRKSAIELCFQQFGLEKLSIGDVQRLEWSSLECKISHWIHTARVFFKAVFVNEHHFFNQIFNGLSEDEAPFVKAVKETAVHLLNFAEAISIGRRSPERLFKVIDLHDALTDLLPEITIMFRSRKMECVTTQAVEIIARLAGSVRGILFEFENTIVRESSKVPAPGGAIHPLTMYVMNYISLILEYKRTLIQLIKLPISSHLIKIIVLLQFNIEGKARLYKNAALSHLFLANNLHYVVRKVKESSELSEDIGNECLGALTVKYRMLANSYERATWVKILHCLREEGLSDGGSLLSSSVLKVSIKARLRAFNAAFEEEHRKQAVWSVQDYRLREELRISIAVKLLSAYRCFLGRFGHYIGNERNAEMYVKYSAEDLEVALADFFEGCSPPLHGRGRFRLSY